jgi:hypothetical protein
VSTPAEFFLGSNPSVARYDCLEISHPNFSQTYRLVRNNPAGLTVTQAEAGLSWIFTDGANEVNAGDVLDRDRLEPWSASAWINVPAGGRGFIVGKYDHDVDRGWRLILDNNDDLSVWHVHEGEIPYDRIFVATDAVSTIQGEGWVHVGCTYDGSGDASGVKIFINGVPVSTSVGASGDTLTDTTSTSEDFRAGWVFSGDTELAHVAVWMGELSEAQMAEVFAEGRTNPDYLSLATAPVPDVWYGFTETDTESAGGMIDRSGNGLHGTPNFGTTLVDAQVDYEYCPARVLPIASEDDLVQSLAVTLGDVGTIIAAEIANVWAANGMDIRPTLTYRAYRSDDLSAPIEGSTRVLEIANVTTSREGATFEARAPELNANRTGRLYTVEEFPMLAGFQ